MDFCRDRTRHLRAQKDKRLERDPSHSLASKELFQTHPRGPNLKREQLLDKNISREESGRYKRP
jgi:hypothetical protein